MPSSNDLLLLIFLALQASPSLQWVLISSLTKQQVCGNYSPRCLKHPGSSSARMAIPFDSLMDMDVVVYSLAEGSDSEENEQKPKILGAVQEDGTISPLSAWSDEPAFGNSVEFLVDEEDRFPGLEEKDVVVHVLIDQSDLSYGSRQVGGGKGPGNPHGEESELLYYIEQDIVKDLDFPIKPQLEILW